MPDASASSDQGSLTDVIDHVHQIGWQLRLGEHTEAKRQAEDQRGAPTATDEELEHMRELLSASEYDRSADGVLESMRQGVKGKQLNN
ncbi:MAG: hypothetical protein ACRDP4_11575 [Nocardioidaceae bacterium]